MWFISCWAGSRLRISHHPGISASPSEPNDTAQAMMKLKEASQNGAVSYWTWAAYWKHFATAAPRKAVKKRWRRSRSSRRRSMSMERGTPGTGGRAEILYCTANHTSMKNIPTTAKKATVEITSGPLIEEPSTRKNIA